MVFGVKPPCEGCERPRLAPGNILVWEIYRVLAGSFCQDYGVEVFGVMGRYGVPERRQAWVLDRLKVIHEIARKNADRGSGQ